MYVVTYQTPRNEKLSICSPCEERLKRHGLWPRTSAGYYAQVHYGGHSGACDLHDGTVETDTMVLAGSGVEAYSAEIQENRALCYGTGYGTEPVDIARRHRGSWRHIRQI